MPTVEQPSLMGLLIGTELQTYLAHYQYSKLIRVYRHALAASLFPKMALTETEKEGILPYRLETKPLKNFLVQNEHAAHSGHPYDVVLPTLHFNKQFLKYFSKKPDDKFSKFLEQPSQVVRFKRLWNLLFLVEKILVCLEDANLCRTLYSSAQYLADTEEVVELLFSLDIDPLKILSNGFDFSKGMGSNILAFLPSVDIPSAENAKLFGFWAGVFISQLTSKTCDYDFLAELALSLPDHLEKGAQSIEQVKTSAEFLLKKWQTENTLIKKEHKNALERHTREALSELQATIKQQKQISIPTLLVNIRSIVDLVSASLSSLGSLQAESQAELFLFLRMLKYDFVLEILIFLDKLEVDLCLKCGVLSDEFIKYAQNDYQKLIKTLGPLLSSSSDNQDLYELLDDSMRDARMKRLDAFATELDSGDLLLRMHEEYLKHFKNANIREAQTYFVALEPYFKKIDSQYCEEVLQALSPAWLWSWQRAVQGGHLFTLTTKTAELLHSKRTAIGLRRGQLKVLKQNIWQTSLYDIFILKQSDFEKKPTLHALPGQHTLIVSADKLFWVDAAHQKTIEIIVDKNLKESLTTLVFFEGVPLKLNLSHVHEIKRLFKLKHLEQLFEPKLVAHHGLLMPLNSPIKYDGQIMSIKEDGILTLEPSKRTFEEILGDSQDKIDAWYLKRFNPQALHNPRAQFILPSTSYSESIKQALDFFEQQFSHLDTLIQVDLKQKKGGCYFLNSNPALDVLGEPCQVAQLKCIHDVLYHAQQLACKLESLPRHFSYVEKGCVLPLRQRIDIVDTYFKFNNLLFFYMRSDLYKPFLMDLLDRLNAQQHHFQGFLNTYALQTPKPKHFLMSIFPPYDLSPKNQIDHMVHWFMLSPDFIKSEKEDFNTPKKQQEHLALSAKLQMVFENASSYWGLLWHFPSLLNVMSRLKNQCYQLMEVSHDWTIKHVGDLRLHFFTQVLIELDEAETKLGLKIGSLTDMAEKIIDVFIESFLQGLQVSPFEAAKCMKPLPSFDRRIQSIEKMISELKQDKKDLKSKQRTLVGFVSMLDLLKQVFVDLGPLESMTTVEDLASIDKKLPRMIPRVMEILRAHQSCRPHPTVDDLMRKEERAQHERILYLFKVLGYDEAIENLPELLTHTQKKLESDIKTQALSILLYQKKKLALDEDKLKATDKYLESLLSKEISYMQKNKELTKYPKLQRNFKDTCISRLNRYQESPENLITDIHHEKINFIKLEQLMDAVVGFRTYIKDQQKAIKDVGYHCFESEDTLLNKDKLLVDLVTIIFNKNLSIEARLNEAQDMVSSPGFKSSLLSHRSTNPGLFDKCWQAFCLFLEWLGLLPSERKDLSTDIEKALKSPRFFDKPPERVNVSQLQRTCLGA